MPDSAFQKIIEFLGTVIAGRKRVRRREAGLLVLLGAASVFLLAPGAVALQPHFGYAAIMYLLLTVLVLAAVLARAAWLIKKPPSPEKVALEIELERKDLGNNLISSLQLFPAKNALLEDDPTSPALIDALVLETAGQVGELSPASFVSNAGARRMRGLAAALGGTAFAIGLLWPGIYPRAGYLVANAIDLMPSRITHLYLSASANRILAGSDVVFKVRAEGRSPGRVELEFTPAGKAPSNKAPARLAMERSGENRFRVKWKGGSGGVRVVARTGRFRSAPVELQVVPPPRVEAIEIVYFPPDYTPFPSKRQTGNAHIRAFLGSSVLVRVKPAKPVREALLHLADGWRIALKPGKDSFLEGLILVGSPGSYQVRLKDLDGFTNPVPVRYRIDIIPDTPPAVKVIKPGKDLTLEADNAIRMRYRVSDDFGVRVVNLELRIGRSRPRRIRLWGGEIAKKIVQGDYLIDLRALGLRPGSSLAYRVVAEDTDTVSGPKRGVSPIYRIRIRDREAVIASLDNKLKEISSRLLDLLGDYLEKEVAPDEFGDVKKASKSGKPPGGKPGTRTAKREKTLFDKAWEIMKKIRGARDILRPNNPREALASMDLATLSRRLREVMNRYLIPPREGKASSGAARRDLKRREERRLAQREEATESIERLASMGEDMLRNVRMDRAGKTADELMRRQRALARALEKMRRSGEVDERTMRRVEKELARLREELARLMNQLASLAQRMPSEFMNQRGMRNAPMQNMMSAFDKIRRQMRKGDFRGALDTLRRLMSQIQRLRLAMRGMRRNQMSAQRGGRPMQRRQTELDVIVKEQQAILGETIEVFDGAVGRTKKERPGSLKRFARYLRVQLAAGGKLADRIRKLDCVSLAKSAEGENSLFENKALREALEAIPGFKMMGAPKSKLSKEERTRMAKDRRDEIRRSHREALSEIEGYIKRGDWRDVHGFIRGLSASIQNEPCIGEKEKKAAASRWEEARIRLDGHLRKAEEKSPPHERRKLGGLQKRQKALGGRLAEFRDRLRRLMQLYPFLDSKPLERIEEAKKAMASAEGALGRRRSSAAIPSEERVLELLAQARNQMNRSMQRMARRGRLGMGTPRGLGVYRSAGRGWWAQNPNLPGLDSSPRRGREGQDGRQGIDFSEVHIPDREQYQVPQKFREEVMEALREGLPDSLRSEIENYYERLTR
ncbi:MAG: DUF4175 family protein [Nitrospinota bacterium]